MNVDVGMDIARVKFWSVEELSTETVLADIEKTLMEISQNLPEIQYTLFGNCRVPFHPTMVNRICLVLSFLNDPGFDHSLWERFNDHELYSIIGTSGTGKTIRAFSFLSKNFGFYFSCAEPSLTNFGSSDMHFFIESLRSAGRITRDSKDRNYEFVKRYMRCIVLARLLILVYFRRTVKNFTPEQWLVLQLFPPKVSKIDIFQKTVRTLRQLSKDALDKLYEIYAKEIKFNGHTYTYADLFSLEGPFPAFLDESQMLRNLYPFLFNLNNPRSLYSAVCRSICDEARISLCTIGTGLALTDVQTFNASDSFKSFGTSSKTVIVNFRYHSAADVGSYVGRFFAVPDELSFIFEWLKGRPRLAALFVEHIYFSKLSFQSCESFVKRQTEVGHPDGKSIYNDIEKFATTNRSQKDIKEILRLMDTLRNAVQLYFYSGSAYYGPEVELFELGFGILIEKSRVLICEPIVVGAAFNFFFGGNTENIRMVPAKLMNLFQTQHSALGFLFEWTIPHVVTKLLSMNEEQRKAAFGGAKGWRGNRSLLESSSKFFVPFCRKESKERALGAHLVSPDCLLLSLNENRGADFAASLCHTGNNNKKTGEISIQAKFRKNFHQDDAMKKSTWKPFVYSVGIEQIRVLVAYPKKTKFKLCTVGANLCTLIIDQRNAHHFFGTEELVMFDFFKVDCGDSSHLEDFDSICDDLGIDKEQ
jgi:hypothetical protein